MVPRQILVHPKRPRANPTTAPVSERPQSRMVAVSLLPPSLSLPSSLSSLLSHSARVRLVTREQADIGVPALLLSLHSLPLSSLLSSLPCTVWEGASPTLLLPEHSSQTVTVLLDLLRWGGTARQLDLPGREEVLGLARQLGIKLALAGQQEEQTDDVGKSPPKVNFARKLEKELGYLLQQKVKGQGEEEGQEGEDGVESGHGELSCGECKVSLPSVSLLGYHYSKHFLSLLGRPQFSHMYKDKMCLSCEETFYDRDTLLSHLGVKHQLVNTLLLEKGWRTLQLEKVHKRKHVKTEPGTAVDSSPAQSLDTDPVPASPPSSSPAPFSPVPNLASPTLEKSCVCQLCGKKFPSTNKLGQHMCAHYIQELKALASMYSGTTCTPCGTTYSTENALMLHLGLKHRKINTLLEAAGKEPLDLKHIRPINNTKDTKEIKETMQFRDAPDEKENKKSGEVKETLPEALAPIETKSVPVALKGKGLQCEMCGKDCKFPVYLAKHYVNDHFLDRLKTEVGEKFEGQQCRDCKKEFTNSKNQALHLGMKHGRLNDFLKEAKLNIVNFKTYDFQKSSRIKTKVAQTTRSLEEETKGETKRPGPFVDETVQEDTENINDKVEDMVLSSEVTEASDKDNLLKLLLE